MLLKLILVVTCLCAAQATYIIQAPDSSNDAGPSARICYYEQCNTFCRNHGYIWGSCTGINTCGCFGHQRPLTKNANPEQNKVEINKDNNEDTNKLNADKLTDDFNFPLASEEVASVFASARVCTNNACNSLCHYLGYIWGQCISANTCRCYRSALALEENTSPEDIEVKINNVDEKDSNVRFAEIENTVDDFNIPIGAKGAEARSCTDNVCNSLCHNLGYQWGHCISATICRCYRYGFAKNVNADDSLVEGNEIDHDSDDEDDTIESGYKTFLAKVVPTAAENAVNMKSARACNADICNRNCQASHYDKGICIINRCQCLGRPIWFRAENSLKEAITEPISPRACCSLSCGRRCGWLGYACGVCVRCTCECRPKQLCPNTFRGNPVETENAINQDADALNEVNEGPAVLERNLVPKSRSLSDCNNLWCAQTCRRMGFPDGVCVNDHCKCDIL